MDYQYFQMQTGSNIRYQHYNGVIMSALTSQITSLMIVYPTIYSRGRSKKTSKLRVSGLCAANSPVTGEFPAQRASNAENVSIWWRHHDIAISSYQLQQNVQHWSQFSVLESVFYGVSFPIVCPTYKTEEVSTITEFWINACLPF